MIADSPLVTIAWMLTVSTGAQLAIALALWGVLLAKLGARVYRYLRFRRDGHRSSLLGVLFYDL